MEILKETFEAVLPRVLEAIHEADFVAVDTELTGLHGAPDLVEDWLDAPEERYNKLKKTSEAIMVTQLGVCTFQWIPEERRYHACPFSFYVFPQSSGRVGRRFTCETTAFEFVAANDFDFNKWIKQGIPWLTAEQEEKMAPKDYSAQDDIQCTEGPDHAFVEDTCGLVDQWLAGKGVEKGWSMSRDAQSLIMPSCNSFR